MLGVERKGNGSVLELPDLVISRGTGIKNNWVILEKRK